MTEVVTPAAPAAPAAAPVPAAPEAPVVETKPEKTFTQAELDDILEKRLSKERRKRDDLQRRLTVTEELALRGRQPEEPKKPDSPEGAVPKREDFDSYEAYLEAKAEWRADQAVDKKLAKQKEDADRTRTTEEQQKKATDFRKRTQESAKGLEDFEEVMREATSSPDSPVSRLFAEPINECENPAKVLFHLAKNPDEAERIAALGQVGQAREILKLEQKLASAPPPKKPSNAPEPIIPVGGKATVTDDMPDPKDTKAWVAWRNKQELAKRKGT